MTRERMFNHECKERQNEELLQGLNHVSDGYIRDEFFARGIFSRAQGSLRKIEYQHQLACP
jgi:hypothetical protein